MRRVAAEGMPLTGKEREIVRFLALGKTVKEAGPLVGCSWKTVDVHKTRAMRKLGVHNRADLTRRAIRDGLVEP